MPWQRRDVIQFCLLLLCVPLQYYVSGYFLDVKDTDRSQIIISFMKTIDKLKEAIFNFDHWTENWHRLMLQAFFPEALADDNDNDNEEFDGGDAVEIEEDYDLTEKYLTVKDVRPDNLKYRVGQVVQLYSPAYRGVIIGWDYDKEVSEQAVYQVLVDESHLSKDIVSAVIQVPEDKLYTLKNFQVAHKYIKRYFEFFDGTQFVPKAWLKKLYPMD